MSTVDVATHDCMEVVSSESNDEYGVAKDRYLGVQSKHIHHAQFEGGRCAQVEWYVPLISTVSLGEYVEMSEEDSFIRVKLVEIATRCREQAEELIRHAERLEAVAGMDEVLSSEMSGEERVKTGRIKSREVSRQDKVESAGTRVVGRYKVDAASLNEL